MHDPKFTTPDIGFIGETIELNVLSDIDIHLLAQRAPVIVYSLDASRRKSFLAYLEKCNVVSPVNTLLLKMLKGEPRSSTTIVKVSGMKLKALIGEASIEKIPMPKRWWLSRNKLLEMLQTLFFSEKSSFAQSGIFASCIAQNTDKTVYNNPWELLNANITLLVACTVDEAEHSFLPDMIKWFKDKVGRLLAWREPVRFNDIDKKGKIGLYEHAEGNQELEVLLGDKDQRYESPRIDENSGAIIIPLCPNEVNVWGNWIKAETIKYYEIQEEIVRDVVNKGSRKELARRNIGVLQQTDTLKPGETRIMEIPIDIWPYDADLEVVCVGKDGLPLNVIHFPATYLDAVRTFADGENRMQVEIKNTGTEPIAYKDIYFRVKLFETGNKDTREKFELRRAVQNGEKKGFYPLEHLVYTKVLHGNGEEDLQKHSAGLWHLSNLDNFFPGDDLGLLFYQKESEGKKTDEYWVIGKVGDFNDWTPCLLNLNLDQKVGDLVVKNLPATINKEGYQKDFFSIMGKACSIGREKKVIFTCRSNIEPEDLIAIIEKYKITDILCIPGHDFAKKPSLELVRLCNARKVKLTSIEIVSANPGEDTEFDMVWGKRQY